MIDYESLAKRFKDISDPYENDGVSYEDILNDIKESPYHCIEYLLDLYERIEN